MIRATDLSGKPAVKIARMLKALAMVYRSCSDRRSLMEMPEHLLRDIGIERRHIPEITGLRAMLAGIR